VARATPPSQPPPRSGPDRPHLEGVTQARVTGAFAGLATVLLAARPGVLRANLRQVAYLVAFALLGLNGVQLFYFLPIERLPIGIAVLIEYVAPVLVALYAALVLRHRLGRGLGVRGERRVLGGRRAAVVVPVAPARRPGRRRRRARRGDAAQGVLVAWVVVLGTLIPFALLLSALHALPAARVTLLSTWEPLAAAIVAWAWLSERLSGTQVGAQRSSSPAS
jgi:drug/metabolite transporter (DMT)-like permease